MPLYNPPSTGSANLTSNAASTQALGDAAAVGTGTAAARDDHKHAMPADPLVVSHGGTGAATLTGLVKGAGTSTMTAVAAPTGAVVGTTDTQTLSAKRITKRIVALSDAATILVNTDNFDKGTVTLGGNRTVGDTSGTPTDGDVWQIAVKQDGTGGRTLAVTGTGTIIGKSVGGGTAVPLDTGIGVSTLLTFTFDATVNKSVLVGCVVLV